MAKNRKIVDVQNQPTSQFSIITQSWSAFAEICSKRGRIMLPMAFMSFLEILAVFVIFIAIQPPFTKFTGPIVVRFWGVHFLHYPLILLTLNEFHKYFSNFNAIVIGSFMTGLTIAAVAEFSAKKDFSLRQLLKKTFLKYVNLIILTVAAYFLVTYVQSIEKKVFLKILSKGPSFLGIAADAWKVLFLMTAIFTSAAVQMFFVFAAQAVMIDGKNFITGFLRSVAYVFTNLFASGVLVVLPLLAYVPIVLLKSNLLEIMKRSIPEISFVVLIAGIVLSLFINLAITITATKAYMLIKGKKS